MVYSNNKLHADNFSYCSKGNSAVSDWHCFKILMFGRRIYSCKKQNKVKKSQTAHAGMATSPTATATLTATQALGHTMNAFADEIAQ